MAMTAMGSWIAEPQVIAGLSVWILNPIIFRTMAYGLQRHVAVGGHGADIDETYSWAEIMYNTLGSSFVYMEGIALALLIYGSAKHSVQGTLVGTTVYFVVQGIIAFWAKEDMLKLKTKVLKLRSDKESPAPTRSTASFHSQDVHTIPSLKSHGSHGPEELSPTNTYCDLEGSFAKCLGKLIVQLLMGWFFFVVVEDVEFPSKVTESQCNYFMSAAVLSVVMRPDVGSFFNGEWTGFWRTYFYAWDAGDKQFVFLARFRCFASWLINHLLQNVVYTLFPLVVINSDTHLDFVKDVTAVLFITSLDNLEIPPEFKVKKHPKTTTEGVPDARKVGGDRDQDCEAPVSSAHFDTAGAAAREVGAAKLEV